MSFYTNLVRARVRARIPRQLLTSGSIYLHRETSEDALSALLVLLAGRVVEKPVELLEGLILCLGDEEEGPQSSDSCEGSEEDEGSPADALEHGRDDEADDKVE